MRVRSIIVVLCSLLFVQAKAQELLNYPLDTVNGEEVYKYEVERGIGLYRIGVNFNVSQADIIRLNPQLRERGLHYGETLLLPTGSEADSAEGRSDRGERDASGHTRNQADNRRKNARCPRAA